MYNSYAQLPDLFGIDAIQDPLETSLSTSMEPTIPTVTIIRGNIDLSLGTSNLRFHVLFILILEFRRKTPYNVNINSVRALL